MSAVSLVGLSKNYGAVPVLQNLSIDVPAGCVLGLLGANGAGKTTTFKCILGLARPSSGHALLNGVPITPSQFGRIGYVPEDRSLYGWMTVAQHLKMQRQSFARYNSVRANELLELFSLNADMIVSSLSKGMHAALMVTLALAIEPEFLFLDEPTSGLDPINQRHVLTLIGEESTRGTTVIISSHQISQIERACDRVAILREGRLLLDDSIDDIKASHKIIEALFDPSSDDLDYYRNEPDVMRAEQSGRILRLHASRNGKALVDDLVARGAVSIRTLDVNLEDVFLLLSASSTTRALENRDDRYAVR